MRRLAQYGARGVGLGHAFASCEIDEMQLAPPHPVGPRLARLQGDGEYAVGSRRRLVQYQYSISRVRTSADDEAHQDISSMFASTRIHHRRVSCVCTKFIGVSATARLRSPMNSRFSAASSVSAACRDRPLRTKLPCSSSRMVTLGKSSRA